MKNTGFPTPRHRNWLLKPEQTPELDSNGLMQLGAWQTSVFRKPIQDQITGFYNFTPTIKGAQQYVIARARKHPAKPQVGDTLQSFQDRGQRLRTHIAESAELATAIFSTVSLFRDEALREALRAVSERKRFSDDSVASATDAIMDYGYCLRNPVQIDFKGENHGQGLRLKIDSFGDNLGAQLEEFGSAALDDEGLLRSHDGVLAMELALAEQDRRFNYWMPRHEAVTEAFPDIDISEEILLLRVSLAEIKMLRKNLPQGTSHPVNV